MRPTEMDQIRFILWNAAASGLSAWDALHMAGEAKSIEEWDKAVNLLALATYQGEASSVGDGLYLTVMAGLGRE